MLISGGLSDVMDRKMLLLGTFFVQTFCTFLSAYVDNFQQLLALRILIGVLGAVSGPCSYGLLTDWVPPEQRTMAYALYALGVQIGQPLSEINYGIIEWLGWRDAFNFLALQGFVCLVFCVVVFEEPDRGRFDIQHSVKNSQDDATIMDASHGYDLSEAPTHKRLTIDQKEMDESPFESVKEYFDALYELYMNEAANWIMLAACLRTQQGIAMGIFTGQFFMLYPDYTYEFNLVSTVAGLIGAFACTLGTSIYCDMYDNYDYMTKAKICIYTTLISIPSCCLMYMCTDNFWVSAFGLFVETMLSSAWS